MANEVFALRSKTLKFATKYLPSWTETVWMTNIANAYLMTTRFVKVTNNIIGSYLQIRTEYETMNASLKEVYRSLENLRNVDPYNMDTWEVGLMHAKVSLQCDVFDALQAFRNVTITYSVGATERYVHQIRTLDDYVKQYEFNKKTVEKYYVNNAYTELLNDISGVSEKYKGATLEKLEERLVRLYEELNNEKDAEKKKQLSKEIDEVEVIIANVAQVGFSKEDITDTLMQKMVALITINMNEIQVLEQDIRDYSTASADLVESYHTLKNGETKVYKKKTLENEVTAFTIPVEKYATDDPDKVPAPKAPETKTESQAGGRIQIATEDVLYANNAAEFLQLKQLHLRRDLMTLIAQTSAMVAIVEAYEQHHQEELAFAQGVGFKATAIRIQNAAKKK